MVAFSPSATLPIQCFVRGQRPRSPLQSSSRLSIMRGILYLNYQTEAWVGNSPTYPHDLQKPQRRSITPLRGAGAGLIFLFVARPPPQSFLGTAKMWPLAQPFLRPAQVFF